MADAIGKFQQLLRELFQFDCADLDFGIYRIMNYKREVIEKFVQEKLPNVVATELDSGLLADQSQAANELAETTQEVKETLGEDALNADGELVLFHHTPIGEKYLNAKAKAAGTRSRAAVETDIYNHLYAFFSRYYQDGDFISKRRYSKHQRYAIPYNGEEVYLHWANRDQYYIKTGEHFRDYDWKAPNGVGVAVRFRLKAADVEQNNVKGDKRFFLPLAEAAAWDADARVITIPFEYRPLTATEIKNYGKQSQQDKIIAEALAAIPKRLSKAPDALAALNGERRRNGKDESVSHLEHHLRKYTRRNTSDFFIHKDLAAFLSRELDFYLKSEVLNLDEMTAAGEGVAEGWFQQLQLIKLVGSQVIAFLAQMENFQKMLWEKRKFVTETQYCIALGSIDAAFYSDIAANDAQWDEWRELFHIDEAETHLFNSNKNGHDKRIDFLKTHPTLVLDTAHFERDFADRLLASFDDIDGMTDGLLVHSENWQALNLLTERYREEVTCIYIDPPYNKGDDGFIYKDNYQHSSWLLMIENRIITALHLMAPTAITFVSIDDNEQHHLRTIMDKIFNIENFLANISWQGMDTVKNDARYFSGNCENIITFTKSITNVKIKGIMKTEHQRKHYRNYDNDPRGDYLLTPLHARSGTPDSIYTFELPNGQIWTPPEGTYPRFSPTTLQRLLDDGRIYLDPEGKKKPQRKTYWNETDPRMRPTTFWDYKTFGSTRQAKMEIVAILGRGIVRDPKPSKLVRTCIDLVAEDNAIVLDYFAGSGTTGHAVINLNREDSGQRKFILVEMGEYFDTVLLPRIKKVAFAPEWKDGKPKRDATPEEAQRSPRIVKYIRLESYEDALDSIAFDDAAGQLKLEEQFDDYLIKYMLQWETKGSETLLNVEKLSQPFYYRLRVHADGETRERTVDLPETFNYLLGLKARTRQVYADRGRCYLVYRGETRDAPGRKVAVVWRETEEWAQADFERDRQFVAEQGLAEGADAVYVNGDSCIPNATAIEPLFKARMFAGVEQ